jgi:integrase/recombinase XerC
MTKHNPENERIKRRYFDYLKEAKRYSEQSVDTAAKALKRFEEYNHYRSFKAFHFQQAVAFKRHLKEQRGQRSGENLSKATLHATLTQLKKFFFWLAGQPGYKSSLQYTDADYFNLSENETRIATAHREQPAPTLEQVKHVIQAMPARTDIERRDRALVAFTLLTGARDSAIASMKLKHINLTEGYVYQDPREVKTKFSKAITTYFFPVGDDVQEIVAEWVKFLREDKLWGNDDPLFPATRIETGASQLFEATGLDRKHWSTATPIRTIFRKAFEQAGVLYFNPHSIRKTLALLGEQLCKSPEEFKAWSQNYGHNHVLTTFTSYGAVRQDRQGEIIRKLGLPQQSVPAEADGIAEAVLRKLQSVGVSLPPSQ